MDTSVVTKPATYDPISPVTVLHTHDDARWDVIAPDLFHFKRLQMKDAYRGARPLYIELAEAMFNVLAPWAHEAPPLPVHMRLGTPIAVMIMLADPHFRAKIGREISVEIT